MKKDMRAAALPIALLSILVGIVGIASPQGAMAIRRLYFATPGLAYTVVAVRSAMGLGLILAASNSSWPKVLRALGPRCACKDFRRRFSDLIARERSWNGRECRDPPSFAPGPRRP